MRGQNNISKIVLIVMLGIFSLLVINNSLYRHNHLVAGYLYSHAHPFEKGASGNPVQSHSHSVPELILLDLLTDSDFLQIVFFTSLIGLASFVLFNFISGTSEPLTRLVRVKIPRAPPV